MSFQNPIFRKNTETELEQLKKENEKLREIIDLEQDPDKRYIYLLKKQLSDCKHIIKLRDRQIAELKNKICELKEKDNKVIRMKVIEEPRRGSRTVLYFPDGSDIKPLVEGKGTIDYVCGKCENIIGKGVIIPDTVYRCPRCNEYNEFEGE